MKISHIGEMALYPNIISINDLKWNHQINEHVTGWPYIRGPYKWEELLLKLSSLLYPISLNKQPHESVTTLIEIQGPSYKTASSEKVLQSKDIYKT